MPFKPGQSGNPKGRPRKPSKKFKLSIKEIAAQQNIDTLVLLAGIVSAEKVDLPLRLQAAGLLAPFQHIRKTARYLERAIELPVPTTVEEATANIAKLASLAAAKAIGLDEMQDLINAQRVFVEVRVGLDLEMQMAELRQIVERLSASASIHAVNTTIRGGLPVMPGHENVKLPVLGPPANGGDFDSDPTPESSG